MLLLLYNARPVVAVSCVPLRRALDRPKELLYDPCNCGLRTSFNSCIAESGCQPELPHECSSQLYIPICCARACFGAGRLWLVIEE